MSNLLLGQTGVSGEIVLGVEGPGVVVDLEGLVPGVSLWTLVPLGVKGYVPFGVRVTESADILSIPRLYLKFDFY